MRDSCPTPLFTMAHNSGISKRDPTYMYASSPASVASLLLPMGAKIQIVLD